MRIYLDASAIIYALESAAPFRDRVISRIAQAEDAPGRGCRHISPIQARVSRQASAGRQRGGAGKV